MNARQTIEDLTTNDIVDRIGDISEGEAERMREVVMGSEWANTPVRDIPEDEWIRMLDEALD